MTDITSDHEMNDQWYDYSTGGIIKNGSTRLISLINGIDSTVL